MNSVPAGTTRQLEIIMNATNWERRSAASGYVVILLGVAAAAFERGGPPANAPVEEAVVFFAKIGRNCCYKV
jgi:hypothetical protein